MRKTDAGGIRALLPRNYLPLETCKGKRALATAVERLLKSRVIKTPFQRTCQKHNCG